jgi:signal recognition particle GTPase
VQEQIAQLTQIQQYIVVAGVIGFFIALYGIKKFLKSKKTLKTTSSLGIHRELKETNSLWSALEKSRQRFSLSSHADQKIQESVEEACLASDLGILYTQEALAQVPWDDIQKSSKENREILLREKLAEIFFNWLENSKTSPGSWPEKKEDSPTIIW